MGLYRGLLQAAAVLERRDGNFDAAAWLDEIQHQSEMGSGYMPKSPKKEQDDVSQVDD